jgi:hypothetical protein
VQQTPLTSMSGGNLSASGSSIDSQLVVASGTSGTSVKFSTVSGLLKAASGVISAATSGTDYAPATSGSSILKGNGSGGFSAATAETDFVTPTGTGTLSGKTITALKEVKTAPSIASNVLTIDCSTGNAFAVALNANITSFTVSNIPASGTFYGFILEFTADGTARTVTWSFQGVTVKWAGATAPTLTSTSGKRDSFVFYTYDGGTSWIGSIVGQAY